MLEMLRKRLLDALDGCRVRPCPDAELDEQPRLDACADENEFASRVVEVGMQIALRRRLEERRGEIEAALKRMDTGCYGDCEECGEEIGLARLMANPTAQLCVHCQADNERGRLRRCA
ncbi:MAG: TraR/DksA family transcriptional regulator [Humidesulfovibrio sp.]|jgi:DnaK suppressor protein|uniref:TraR/DksA family transcriptional regulator n=1 Tax=Humidesulfovibrio sp. TaxID=2910988 RepID=UPI00273324DA|nr:TraR/DksA family transcriptional regulator [Humidesulfovibrio sp.]MDP2847657.1 TraR/DksA family transcriptional regulator [Humidesulfovibrio sp.]MDQ7835359.1 TraR/DksA family transcriptional regulator [Humidesulfovibrio sp.]